MALDLPTTEQNSSTGEQKKALPAGSYQAKLTYYFFDQETYMGTQYAYQDVGLRWLIVPGDASEDEEVAKALDENGFYPYTDKFNELSLKAAWTDTKSKRTFKASPFIRRLNALVGPLGTSFSEEHGKRLEYVVNEEKFEALGSFPVYANISKKEADAYKEAHGGVEAMGNDQYKPTERTQTIYKGVVNDIKVNGVSTVEMWAALDLGLNAKGYNTAGANAVRALNNLERMGLKGAGYDVPGVTGKKASPAGAPL